MKYKAYPKYKDSGVEWMGEVPEHWEVKLLKYVASINDEVLLESTPPDLELLYVDIGSVDRVEGITNKESMIFENAPSRARRMVSDGDTIVSTVRTYLRAISPVQNPESNLVVSTGFAVIRPRKADPEYFSFFLRSSYFIENVVSRSVGVSYPATNATEVIKIPIVRPHSSEQVYIATFLNRETKKIDILVAKKRMLIEKLKEKRTALISRTVTRGLPPEAALAAGLDPYHLLKPSGVEWLGNVPEHWEVKRLKYIIKAKKGAIKTGPFGSQLQSSDMLNGEVKVYNQRTVLDNDVLGGENYITSEKYQELNAFEVYPGDILVTTRGTIGRCMIVPLDAEKGILHPCLMRIQAEQEVVCNRYLELLIDKSSLVLEQLKIMSNATTIEVIYSQSLKEVWLPIPPSPEQKSIIEYLDSETTKIDKIICKVESAIDRLQEYRTALITAAVTGKIDVRET